MATSSPAVYDFGSGIVPQIYVLFSASIRKDGPDYRQIWPLWRVVRWSDLSVVCPECGCTFGVWRSTLLHWLPVRRRVNFKMASDHPGLPVTVRHGSSLSSRLLALPVVRRTYSNYGDRCFAAADPPWNSLPADLRQADINF